MTPEEEAKVRALRWEPIDLLKSIRADTRIEETDAARRRGAPPPSTTRAGIMHMRNAPAHTSNEVLDRNQHVTHKYRVVRRQPKMTLRHALGKCCGCHPHRPNLAWVRMP